MKNNIALFAILMVALGVTGCKKFLDINNNPNNPTEESVTPNLVLSSSLTRMADQTSTSYAATARWMGYWTRSGTYGPNAEEESYHITTTYEAGEWSTWYDILNDLNVMENKADVTGEDYYVGAAKVLKTIGFMYLVDQYNNVPYTTAFDINSNILPTYDKGSDIYTNLFVQLDSAEIIFSDLEGVTDENSEFDIMFGDSGDPLDSWLKLINTQRLKLALRLVNVAGFNAATQMDKINANGHGFIETSANVQPGYVQDADKQSPFWDNFKRNYVGDLVDNFNRANNYVLNKYSSNNDSRYTRIFTAVGSSTNYVGLNYGEVVDDAPNAANSSDVAGPGLANSASQPQWFFTSVESKFLQAEAIARGWIAGDAQAAYQAAITESFVWLGLTADDASAYYSQDSPVVAWPATQQAQISQIVWQKYLALCGVNNFEAWVDYRRVGVPSDLPLSLSPSRSGYIIPLRLMYPQDEYNYNPQAVAAEGTINPQSDKIFWDLN